MWQHIASQLLICSITSSALIGPALDSLFLCSKHDVRFVSRGQRRDNAGRSFLSWFQDCSFVFLLVPIPLPEASDQATPGAYSPSAGAQPHPTSDHLSAAFPTGTPSPQASTCLASKLTLGNTTASEHLPCSSMFPACPVTVAQCWLRQPGECHHPVGLSSSPGRPASTLRKPPGPRNHFKVIPPLDAPSQPEGILYRVFFSPS